MISQDVIGGSVRGIIWATVHGITVGDLEGVHPQVEEPM
jgi:hypothetical protein